MILKFILLLAACSIVLGSQGYWGPWDDWSVCSKSCGGGQQTRTRQCLDGTNCIGISTEQKECFPETCPLTLPIGALTQWPYRLQATINEERNMGVCMFYGFPRLITFDGDDFLIDPKCSYTMAKNIHSVGRRNFQVDITTTDQSVSSVKITLQQEIYHTEILVNRTGTFVDGVVVYPNDEQSTPCSGCLDTGSHFLIYAGETRNKIIIMAFDFQVVYTSTNIELFLEEEHANKVRGLCGTYNQNPGLFVSKTGSTLPNLQSFLQEWKIQDGQHCGRKLLHQTHSLLHSDVDSTKQCTDMVNNKTFENCFIDDEDKHQQELLCERQMNQCLVDPMVCFCRGLFYLIDQVCKSRKVIIPLEDFWFECPPCSITKPDPSLLQLLVTDRSGASRFTVSGIPTPNLPTCLFNNNNCNYMIARENPADPNGKDMFFIDTAELPNAGVYTITCENEFGKAPDHNTWDIDVDVQNPAITITITPPHILLIGSNVNVKYHIDPRYWHRYIDGLTLYLSGDKCVTLIESVENGTWPLQHRHPGWEFDTPEYVLCPKTDKESVFYPTAKFMSPPFIFNKTHIAVEAPTDKNGFPADMAVVAFGGLLRYTFDYSDENVYMKDVAAYLVSEGETYTSSSAWPMGVIPVSDKGIVLEWRVPVREGIYYIHMLDALNGTLGTEAEGDSQSFTVTIGFLCVTGVKEVIPLGSWVTLYLQVFPETLQESLSSNGTIALIEEHNPTAEIFTFTDVIDDWRSQNVHIPMSIATGWDLSATYRFVVRENVYTLIKGYSDTFTLQASGTVQVKVMDFEFKREVTRVYIGNEYGIVYIIDDDATFVGKGDLYLIDTGAMDKPMLIGTGVNSSPGMHTFRWQAGMELAGWPPSSNNYIVRIKDGGLNHITSGIQSDSPKFTISDACYGVPPEIQLGVPLDIFIRLDDETLSEINNLIVLEENAVQAAFPSPAYEFDKSHRFATWKNPELKQSMEKNTTYRLSFATCSGSSCPSDKWYGKCGPVVFIDPKPESFVKAHSSGNQQITNDSDNLGIGAWIGIVVAVVAVAVIVGLAVHKVRNVRGRKEYEKMATPAQPPTNYGTAEGDATDETARC